MKRVVVGEAVDVEVDVGVAVYVDGGSPPMLIGELPSLTGGGQHHHRNHPCHREGR